MRALILFGFIIYFFDQCTTNHVKVNYRKAVDSSTVNNPHQNSDDAVYMKKAFYGLGYLEYNDSLREEILKKLSNNSLKNSFLQELYIWDMVKILGDSLKFNINLNWHRPSCMAMDGYTTDLSFSFYFKNKVVFPKQFLLTEIDDEDKKNIKKIVGIFRKIEHNDSAVTYHCETHNRTLLFLKDWRRVGINVYYFVDVKSAEVNSTKLEEIYSHYVDTMENSLWPYTCRELSMEQYEYNKFIK